MEAGAAGPAHSGRPLAGRVAVVAGATRGAGRGIARALGEAGATVYCTGRSVPGKPSPYKRPETIDETADLVTAAGGTGIPVRVDHTVDAEVRRLFVRVEKEQRRLDVLVNSVAGEDPTYKWTGALAKTNVDDGIALVRQAFFSHLRTAVHAAPIMIRQKSGLIVEVTEGDTLMGGVSIVHFVVKSGLKLLAFGLADELRKHRITVVAVTPGFLRSEAMLDHFKVTEATWRDGGKRDKHFLQSETPLFVGRGVAALAADPEKFARSGRLTSSWELARHYGCVDADGRRPDWGPYFETIAPQFKRYQEGFRREADWLTEIAARARRYGEA
jgi:NAD(P)-dependent dehydrogenase (short-subunit alcohol dehydrogenase family)